MYTHELLMPILIDPIKAIMNEHKDLNQQQISALSSILNEGQNHPSSINRNKLTQYMRFVQELREDASIISEWQQGFLDGYLLTKSFHNENNDDSHKSQTSFDGNMPPNENLTKISEQDVTPPSPIRNTSKLGMGINKLLSEIKPTVHTPVNPLPTKLASTQNSKNSLTKAAATFYEHEEISISDTEHIGSGETRVYKNKIVHIIGSIQCEGNLEFDTCIIHYNEFENTGHIELLGNGVITMRHCTVEGHADNNKELFITVPPEATENVQILNCECINCCAFLSSHNFRMEHCRVINPGSDFIIGRGRAENANPQIGFINGRSTSAPTEKRVVTDCDFIYQNEPAFIWGDIDSDEMICGRGIQISNCRFEHNSIDMERDEENTPMLIDLSDSTIECSSFSKLERVIRCENSVVRSTVFEDCRNLFYCEEGSKIEDCRFDRCKDFGSGSKNMQISYCQFNDCRDIHSGSSVIFRYCEFNYPSGIKDRLWFSRYDWNRDKCNIVDSCLFNEIHLNQGYYIEGSLPIDFSNKQHSYFDNYVVKVMNSNFVNCSTKSDDGKLIKEYETYKPKFGFKEEIQTVYVENCKGWDRLHKSSEQNVEVTPKTKDMRGRAIGSALSDFEAGFATAVMTAAPSPYPTPKYEAIDEDIAESQEPDNRIPKGEEIDANSTEIQETDNLIPTSDFEKIMDLMRKHKS